MSDRERLAEALEWWDDLGGEWTDILKQAARERLAQLPPFSAELVERIAEVLSWFKNGQPQYHVDEAVAVLDALNRETE